MTIQRPPWRSQNCAKSQNNSVRERNVISNMTVAGHHVKATSELMQEKLTPKWLQLGIQYDPMLRNDTDILDSCKRIQNRFQTDIQLAMLNHHEQLVQQLGEKLTGLDEELVILLKKSGGNAKQFTRQNRRCKT